LEDRASIHSASDSRGDPGSPLAIDYLDASALRRQLGLRTAPATDGSRSPDATSAENEGETEIPADAILSSGAGVPLRCIAEAGRKQSQRFTDRGFEVGFMRALLPALR